MACRLFGTKPLLEPILAYRQLDSWEQMWNFNQNSKFFVPENVSDNIFCEIVAILSKGNELIRSFSLPDSDAVIKVKSFILWIRLR